MNAITKISTTERYARCVETSKRVRWKVEEDVIRGRRFDTAHKFLPDGLILADAFTTLSAGEKRYVSQIQGRTYANIFGLVERFINAKVLEVSRDHWLGDQTALEALVGFSQEELKHQEMFRRIERMIAAGMPAGYTFVPGPDQVAAAVLSKSTWAVLALICHIELFVQAHYVEAIQPDATLSPLYKDVFLYHWKDESQHVILDELEWTRENQKITAAERDRAVDDFIALVGAVDGILQAQSAADVAYFRSIAEGSFHDGQIEQLREGVLNAYRWQYILSGAQHPRFLKFLLGMITPEQAERVQRALAPLAGKL